ncbi:MAG: response regulator [Patescibacteria group bacterium]
MIEIAQNNKSKILLVEDDIFMVDLLVEELTRSGFEVVVAGNGAEGIKQFEAARPDLVLLDLLLPDVRGFEVLKKIRSYPDGESVKVIVFSNVAEQQDMAEAEGLGVRHYMVKANYALPEVVDKIRSVLAENGQK